MKNQSFGGGLTIPTETGFVEETLELLKRWGADAVRDCDGTAMPDEIKRAGYKVYSTYFVARGVNGLQRPCPTSGRTFSCAASMYRQRGIRFLSRLCAGISGSRYSPSTTAICVNIGK